MLTFECDPQGALEITVDADGLAEFLSILGRLEPGDHDHLSTPSWGAYPLTEEFPNDWPIPVHQVTIRHVDAEGRLNHG
jgi:hypothetical protein